MGNKHETSAPSQTPELPVFEGTHRQNAAKIPGDAPDLWQPLAALSLIGALKKSPTRLALKALYSSLIQQRGASGTRGKLSVL